MKVAILLICAFVIMADGQSLAQHEQRIKELEDTGTETF